MVTGKEIEGVYLSWVNGGGVTGCEYGLEGLSLEFLL